MAIRQEVPIPTAQKDRLPSEERMSDEELGNLLAAFGNHEAKALTLALMRPGRIYGRPDLKRILIESQGKQVMWNMNAVLPFDYCQKSLVPIGLVAKEYLDQEKGVYGYEITDYGQEIGIPLAGHLLDFSLRHKDVSLIKLFGSTHSVSKQKDMGSVSYKKRSPLARFKILGEIITRELPVRIRDLERELDSSHQEVGRHLENLSRAGFLEFESIAAGNPYSFYKLAAEMVAEAPQPFPKEVSLSQAIWEILRDNSNIELSANEVTDKLIEINSHYEKFDRKYLRHRVSPILTHFANLDYLTKSGYDQRIRSSINFTKSQKQKIKELLSILYDFQNQDPTFLGRGRKLADDIVGSAGSVRLLLNKAREMSMYANIWTKEDSGLLILSLVRQDPGITNRELQIKMHEKGIDFISTSIRTLTRRLVKSGALIVEKSGTQHRFYIPQDTEEN